MDGDRQASISTVGDNSEHLVLWIPVGSYGHQRPRGLSRWRGIDAYREGSIAMDVVPQRQVGKSTLLEARRSEKRSVSIGCGASREHRGPQSKS